VQDQADPIKFALSFHRGQFEIADILRRAQGNAVGALGLDPSECPFRIIASGPHWRLRDYGDAASHSLLIIAAPIKRPYIWDLTPAASAIRCCLRHGLHVHLLEWLPASDDTGNNGIDECALAIADCVAKISVEVGGSKPFLIGHSLGGTIAAIYAGWASPSIRGLVLLGAPLCFRSEECQFRDALVSLVPPDLSDADPLPGSLLSHMSALASPSTFMWSRLMDAAMSLSDPRALDIHARVERWALDEVALPGKLVHQIIEWLYRENRFCRGALKINEALVVPGSVAAPTLAVINTADAIAPLATLKPFTDAIGAEKTRIIEYQGEVGVCLQHLGILVGHQAHAHVWPEIVSWLKAL
jgi:polyhydroxyalkanoate synthase subunit PhaC